LQLHHILNIYAMNVRNVKIQFQKLLYLYDMTLPMTSLINAVNPTKRE